MAESLQIAWEDVPKTGDRAIDIQHKYLIDIINELAVCIESGTAAQSVKKILNLLKYYTEWHFGREELCMAKHQCPLAEANQNAHKQFMHTFDRFSTEYAQSESDQEAHAIALRMYQTLTDWLVNHIQKIDTSIGTACSGHAAEESASVQA